MPDIFVALPDEKSAAAKAEDASLNTQKEEVKNSDIVEKPYVPPLERRVHIFSSFCKNPQGISFRNQEKDEKILLFLRRSMITNIRWIITSFFLLILPLFVLPFVNLSQPILFLPTRYIMLTISLYYLLIFSYIYVNYITWYFNISLVTNIRVLDIDFSGLIYKNIAATKISLVQDVSFTQIGVLRTFFDFGDVFVQTAGTLENFDFNAVPQPENAVHIIEDLIGKNGGV